MTGNNDPRLAESAATKAGDRRLVAAVSGADRDPGPTCDLNAPSLAEEVVALLDGYLADLKAGRKPDRDQLLRDHPHLASQLEACLAGLEFIHRVEGSGDGSTPARLGDFRIHREVGHGGMGAVYEATQVSLGRRVALKVIRFGPVSDPQAITRFQREAETVARLHHTNIVPIYTVGCEGGVNYYAMEFIDGHCLTDVLRQSERPLEPQTIAAWGLQAAEALAHAHQRGVIHRDVKPSNLLLDGDDRIWLTDFGLARRQDDVTLSMTGALLGTPRYMSPEQAGAAHQRIDHRTDIYSLGATLYELAVGRPPFTADTHHAVISQILSAEPPAPRTLRPDLPRDLETIIVKCLAKEAPQRYASAAELADDLRAFHEGRAIRARRASLPERAVRWVRQQRRSVGLSAAAAAATLLIAITAVASTYGYRRWQTAYLQLATNRPPLVAEVLSSRDAAPLATQTVPTQNPIELPAGDYRLRITGDGRMSQDYQVALARQARTEQRIDLEDQLLWGLNLPRSFAVVDFADGADVLAFDESAIHLHDGATGFHRWNLDLAHPMGPAAEAAVGLKWPWDKGVGTMQGGHDKFDARPWFAPRAADLDGDGSEDVLMAARHQAWLMAISGQSGRLLWLADRRGEENRALDKDAWGVRGTSAVLNPPLIVNDLDGDGAVDCVVTLADLSADYMNATRWIEAISGRSGATVWRHDLPAELFALPSGVEVPYAFRWFVGGPSGSRGSGGYGGSSDMYVKRSGRPVMERTGSFFHMPDMPHAVRIAEEQCIVLPVAGRVIVLNARNGERVSDDATGLSPGQSAVWGDVDGDGAEELALIEDHCDLNVGPPVLSVKLGVWSAASRKMFWQTDLAVDWPARPDWSIPAPEWPLLADLNGDGRCEVLAPVASSESLPFGQSYSAPPWGDLAAFNGADGQPIWQARTRSTDQQADYFTPGPDINGDGWREVFAASLWGNELDMYVEALDGRGGATLWWNRQNLANDGGMYPGLWLTPPRWQSLGPNASPRLLVTALGGNSFSQAISRLCVFDPRDGRAIAVARDAPSATPADADGDGLDDLFVFHSEASSQGGRLDALRGNAGDAWRRLGPALAAGPNLDGDGAADLLEAPTDGQGRVRAYSGASGMPLWDVSHGLGEHQDCRIARTGHSDLNGDGAADLIVYRSGRWAQDGSLLTAISGRDGRRLWNAACRVANIEGVLAVETVDLDGDLRPEVIYAGWIDLDFDPAKYSTLDHQLWIVVLSGRDGSVRWKQALGGPWGPQGGGAFLPYRLSVAPDFVCFADWNADGTRDVLTIAEAAPDGGQFEWRALSGVDGGLLWKHTLPREAYTYDALINTAQPAAGDLDGDGRPEAIVLEFVDTSVENRATRTARVRALGDNGAERWHWELPVDLDCGRIGANSSKADYRPRPLLLRAADGRLRVAVALTTVLPDVQWPNQRATVAVLDHAGQVVLRKDYAATEAAFRIAAGDLDGDGVDEVLIASEGEITAVDPAAPEPPRWKHRLRVRGQNVEFQAIIPPRDQRPAIVALRQSAGDNSMVGLDGATGQPRWVCPGPTPQRDGANIALDGVALLDGGGDGPPRIFYRFGAVSMARQAAAIVESGDTAVASSAPPLAAMIARGHDPRFLRPLPWLSPPREGANLWHMVRAALWSAVLCMALMVLPGSLLWRMVVCRRWGVWTMMALPLVVAISIAFLLTPVPLMPHYHQKYQAASAAFPILLLLWLLVRWTIQARWRRLAVWGVLWIVLTIAAAAVSYRVAVQRVGPLQPGERYQWDGWYVVLLIGVFITALITVVLSPAEAIVRAAWRRLAGKRRVAAAADAT